MKRVCVYAGSSPGTDAAYRSAARDLGSALARAELELVYGGSRHGLMGEVAGAVLSAGGRVTGVMPKGLFDKEVVHTGVTTFIEVESMHERKAMMIQLSDAFIALPGGVGTLEEVLEAVCWAQLGLHRKPVGLLSVQGYYDPLLQMIDQAVHAGFVREEQRALWLSSGDASTLLWMLQAASSAEPQVHK